jgi:hypothetical protein
MQAYGLKLALNQALILYDFPLQQLSHFLERKKKAFLGRMFWFFLLFNKHVAVRFVNG